MLLCEIRGGRCQCVFSGEVRYQKSRFGGGRFAFMLIQERSISMYVFRGGQVPKMRIQERSGTKNEDSGEVVLLYAYSGEVATSPEIF